MSWSEDYSSATGVRNAVITAVVPEIDREEIFAVMRGMELSLVSSDKKMTVSKVGTETIEFYIRYLERKVFNLMDLQAKFETNSKHKVECSMCKGVKFVSRQVKKKREQIVCPKCNGTGSTWEIRDE